MIQNFCGVKNKAASEFETQLELTQTPANPENIFN